MKRSDRITAVVILAAIALVVVFWIVMHRTTGTVAVVQVDGTDRRNSRSDISTSHGRCT